MPGRTTAQNFLLAKDFRLEIVVLLTHAKFQHFPGFSSSMGIGERGPGHFSPRMGLEIHQWATGPSFSIRDNSAFTVIQSVRKGGNITAFVSRSLLLLTCGSGPGVWRHAHLEIAGARDS